ncbi:Guanine nucleotide-binding protein-like 1 [Bagarius yarrelli]|uniref:Guanine nucleotide-binding protein-like 1 n=1 Tax=Bagarius yarrelli TaxID=175774 RepID=A0A556VAA9_BAGYA|nr:Guanine nucleotide-binding protein-like 1 [Bagarius yarrelli]
MPRKKPFSNKQKKKQLQVKREKKRGDTGSGQSSRNASIDRAVRRDRQSDTSDSETTDVRRINHQPGTRNGRYDPNRFRLHFEKESKDEVEKRKKVAREKILQAVPETDLEMDIKEVYPEDQGLDFPRRPSWHYGMRREELLRKERKAFDEFLEVLHSKNPTHTLSHFEHNLETWRQLWRVLEMSDVVLLIVDIRHPVLQFPPALYHYITGELQKQVIVVLNKVDLCPAPLVLAWKHYLNNRFPHLRCVCFTSHPGQPYSSLFQKKRMRRKGGWAQAGGAIHILRACQEITAGKVDLSSWEKKIQRDAAAMGTDGDMSDDGTETVLMEHLTDAAMELNSPTRELYKDGVLTLGCIGFPNVGKSSVLNSLVGKKVVSVSRTPGHTKYFQTYYLTSTVKLCDCPGLVFPSRVSKQLQEPYSSVGYMCERTPFLSVLKLTHPEQNNDTSETPNTQDWTAWDVCEAWAERRGYKTAKAARNDVYRAANSLLRLAMDGRLCLCFRPPGYTQEIDKWESHPDLAEIIALQGRKSADEENGEMDEDDEESSSEPQEEGDIDADEDGDGDDEDESVRSDKKGKIYSLGMFGLLGENEAGIVSQGVLQGVLFVPLLFTELYYASVGNFINKEKNIHNKNKETVAQNKEVVAQNKEVVAQNKEVVAQNKETVAQNKEVVAQNKEMVAQNKEVVAQNKAGGVIKPKQIKGQTTLKEGAGSYQANAQSPACRGSMGRERSE